MTLSGRSCCCQADRLQLFFHYAIADVQWQSSRLTYQRCNSFCFNSVFQCPKSNGLQSNGLLLFPCLSVIILYWKLRNHFLLVYWWIHWFSVLPFARSFQQPRTWPWTAVNADKPCDCSTLRSLLFQHYCDPVWGMTYIFCMSLGHLIRYLWLCTVSAEPECANMVVLHRLSNYLACWKWGFLYSRWM